MGEIVIYSATQFLTLFISAINRPIVLTYVGLLPGRSGSFVGLALNIYYYDNDDDYQCHK